MIVFQLFMCYITSKMHFLHVLLKFLAFIIMLYFEVVYVLLAISTLLDKQSAFTRCFP